MHVISHKAIREFLASHPECDDAAESLDRWYRIVVRAEWTNFSELRADLSSADRVGIYVIFNVGGTKYRVAAEINYVSQLLFVRGIYTHKEYDKVKFK